MALFMGAGHMNLRNRFDIESKTDIVIIVIALLGIAILFLWVALRS